MPHRNIQRCRRRGASPPQSQGSMIILAGDIGGTKSNLGLFERGPDGRPKLLAEESFSTHDFKSPAAMLARFLDGKAKPVDLSGCCLGIAGPVEDGIVVAEWLPWPRVTEQEVAE